MSAMSAAAPLLFFLTLCCCVALSCSTSAAFVGSRQHLHTVNTFEMRTLGSASSGNTGGGADDHRDGTPRDDRPIPPEPAGVRIAYVGNSMLYFNDTPRFFTNLSGGRDVVAAQDSCLRGGATLVSLLEDGNGMGRTFGPDAGAPTVDSLLSGPFEYCVLNDHTQSPARDSTRASTLKALLADYAPLFLRSGVVPIFVATPAYRTPGINDSADLGTVEEFTDRTLRGYEEYASALADALPPDQRPRVAPVGSAYLRVRNLDGRLWEKLYCDDEFHPSPHGTYLQGCVLHWTMFGRAPPPPSGGPPDAACGSGDSTERIKVLWHDARVMQPGGGELPVPTPEEVKFLEEVAGQVCKYGVLDKSFG